MMDFKNEEYFYDHCIRPNARFRWHLRNLAGLEKRSVKIASKTKKGRPEPNKTTAVELRGLCETECRKIDIMLQFVTRFGSAGDPPVRQFATYLKNMHERKHSSQI